MAKEVFANGREMAAKKSGDDAVSAPTDVCHTPPPPPPMAAAKIGIPIPYPNFGKASTLKNGSKTVKIKGGEIKKKNKSFYKKSEGNQPATTQFKEGIVSGVITGKTFASSWSFDVKVEKKNVVRLLDTSKHNSK